jgi:uncharacterized membrane protein HdeD (DUF308 family)
MRVAVMDGESRDAGVCLPNVETLARNWWLVILRGVAGILFGIATLFAPGLSLLALILLFGAYAFADGVLALISAVRRRGASEPWWLLLLEGIAGIAAGVLTLLWPSISALALLYVIAAWAIVTGGFEIAAAIRLRKVITNEWLLTLSGIASVIFGVLIMLFPGAGALALVLWIGAYSLVFGVLFAVLGLKLRSWVKSDSWRSHQHAAHAVGTA